MTEIFLSSLEFDDTKIDFYQSKKLCFSPAYSFFLKSTAEMIDQGFLFPLTDWTDDRCGIIYGKHGEEIISFLLYDLDYDLQERNQTIFISKTFVKLKFRKKGIYKNMEKLLLTFSKDLGYVSVATILSKHNTDYIRCLTETGSKFVCYRTWKKLQ